MTAATLAQDGWCLTFTSPVPIYRATGRVPHSWDVRADWRADYPRCSAVMTEGFPVLERFPVWFYNLPPANDTQPAEKSDCPPNVTLHLELDGFLQPGEPGVFQVLAGEDVRATVEVDGAAIPQDVSTSGVTIGPGTPPPEDRGSAWRGPTGAFSRGGTGATSGPPPWRR